FPGLRFMEGMHRKGQLNENERPFMASRRPVEELYEVASDPHELHNLASLPVYQDTLRFYRQFMDQWLVEADRGVYPEPEAEISFAEALMKDNFEKEMGKKGLKATVSDSEFLAYWEKILQ